MIPVWALGVALSVCASELEDDAQRAREVIERASRQPVERVLEGAEAVEVARRLVVVRYPDGTVRYMAAGDAGEAARPESEAVAAQAPGAPEDEDPAPGCRARSEDRYELLEALICRVAAGVQPIEAAELDRLVHEYVELFLSGSYRTFIFESLADFGNRYRALIEQLVAPRDPLFGLHFVKMYLYEPWNRASGQHLRVLAGEPSQADLDSAAVQALRLCRPDGMCPSMSSEILQNDRLFGAAVEEYRRDPEDFEARFTLPNPTLFDGERDELLARVRAAARR